MSRSVLKVLPIILITFFVSNVCGQEVKFGKISQEELKENIYDKDSTASAAYLYKHRQSYYRYYQGAGLQLITEVQERIKIYDKDGFEHAVKTINLYKSGSSDESISGIKGYTYNMVNGSVEKTKLEKESIFRSEYNKNFDQVKLSMPNVKDGSVIEYEYKISSPFIQSIDEYVFQEEIPIRQLEATLKILEYFKYNQRQKGFYALKPSVSKEFNNTMNINEVRLDYNLSDIPALKEEMYVSNMDNYRSGVEFEIVSLEIPGSTYEVFAKSWEDVVETIYDSPQFGREIQKSNYFEEELDAALEGISGEKKRAQKVLAFVKEKVKWNSYKGVGTDEGVKKAYKIGEGNVADINLMLIAMLKHAGLKANPVLLSTRDNGIPLFPTLSGFNYVVAAAKIDGNYCFLDATDPYATLDVLPVKTLNWFGRMISDTGASEMVSLSPKKKSTEMSVIQIKLNEDGSIQGNVKQRLTDQYALGFRTKYNESSEENYLKTLEKKYNGLEIENYDLANNKDLEKPITQSYDFYMEDMVEGISGKLYMNPMFFLRETENPFKAKERNYPVDFGFAWKDSYIIRIEIPEGYKVESTPEPIIMSLPNNLGSFRYNISDEANNISLKVSLDLNTALVGSDQYPFLKEFYRQVVEKESEKVVLSKISKDELTQSTAGGR